jgi:PleD family two-component response regulator
VSDKPRILIVEDDLDLSEMLTAYFRVQNYDVLTAAWGKEAIEMGSEGNFALAMLDIRLPDIDGYEICRQFRQNRKTQDMPIIFLTEKRDRVDKLQGLEMGVVDYITKPFDIQELRLRVRNAIERATRQSPANPVTDLPEGELIDEKLKDVLQGTPTWAALRISVQGVGEYRDRYGFVEADNLLRVLTMLIRNAAREHGGSEDFIGHLEAEDFLMITHIERAAAIREHLELRFKNSGEYFYPLKDRQKLTDEGPLKLTLRLITASDGSFADAASLKSRLLAAPGAPATG